MHARRFFVKLATICVDDVDERDSQLTALVGVVVHEPSDETLDILVPSKGCQNRACSCMLVVWGFHAIRMTLPRDQDDINEHRRVLTSGLHAPESLSFSTAADGACSVDSCGQSQVEFATRRFAWMAVAHADNGLLR